MCKLACMETPRDQYYTELYRTITDLNDCNGETFSNYNIRYAIHRFIVEEEADSRDLTADTFCQTPVTPNTQGENENAILTSERLNNSDALKVTLKGLKINEAGYYESEK